MRLAADGILAAAEIATSAWLRCGYPVGGHLFWGLGEAETRQLGSGARHHGQNLI
jgi:hypothetical protein